MSQTNIPTTPGTGVTVPVDAESTSGTGNLRQVVVLGDANTDANVGTAFTQPVSLLVNTPVGTAASGSTDIGSPVKVGAVYNSSAPVFSTTQRTDLQSDVGGNLKDTLATLLAGEDLTNNVLGTIPVPLPIATYAPLTFSNIGANVTANIKATPGCVLSVNGSNINSAARYLQLHNTATTPSTNAVPVFSFPLSAGASTTINVQKIGNEFFGNGVYFSTGIAFAWSTNGSNYIAATSTDHTINGTYI